MASSQGKSSSDHEKEDDGYLVLVEFAHKHLDFLLPELVSVLEMSGILVESNISSQEDIRDSLCCDDDIPRMSLDYNSKTIS